MIKFISHAIVACLFLILGILVYFTCTEPGMQASFQLAKQFIPGELSASHLSGRWFGKFSIRNLKFKNDELQLHVATLQCHWQPLALLKHKLLIYKLYANKVDITQLSKTKQQSKSSFALNVQIDDAELSQIRYKSSPTAEPQLFNQLSLSGNIASKHVQLKQVFLKTDDWVAAASGTARWQAPYPINLKLTVSNPAGAKQKFHSQSSIKGNLKHLLIDVNVNAPHKIQLHGTIKQVNAKPNIHLTALWDYLRWPLFGEPEWQSRHGKLTLDGPLNSVNLKLAMQLTHADIPKLDINAHGNVTKTRQGRNIQLTLAPIPIAQLGITLRNTRISVIPQKNNTVALSVNTQSGNGSLQVKGILPLAANKPNQQLSFTGKQFLLADNPKYKIIASPKLRLRQQQKQLLLSGTIQLPSADIKPHDLSQSINLPDDVIIIDRHAKPKLKADIKLPLTTRIQLRLGKDVKIEFMGIRGNLRGRLQILDQADETTTATGQLRLVSGKYNQYGQALKIVQGDVLYSGGPIDNPSIQFRAQKTITVTQTVNPFKDFNATDDISLDTGFGVGSMNQITVGVSLTGNAQNPKVEFYSMPGGLSQSDILSYLILGRSYANSTTADSQLLLAALSSIDAANSELARLTQSLQKKIGLDEFSFSTNTYRDDKVLKTQAAITLGKALTSRLYLNYTVGLLKANNIVQIRYLIAPNWILQTSSSIENNSVDVLYTFERK